MRGFRAEPILYSLPVSEGDFFQVQKILAIKRQQDWRGTRKLKDDPFLFRDFVRCGACDSRVVPITNSGREY